MPLIYDAAAVNHAREGLCEAPQTLVAEPPQHNGDAVYDAGQYMVSRENL